MKKTVITIAITAVLAGTVGYKAGTHTKENEVNQSCQSGYSKGYNQGFYDGYHYDVRTEDYGEFEDYSERYPKK